MNKRYNWELSVQSVRFNESEKKKGIIKDVLINRFDTLLIRHAFIYDEL